MTLKRKKFSFELTELQKEKAKKFNHFFDDVSLTNFAQMLVENVKDVEKEKMLKQFNTALGFWCFYEYSKPVFSSWRKNRIYNYCLGYRVSEYLNFLMYRQLEVLKAELIERGFTEKDCWIRTEIQQEIFPISSRVCAEDLPETEKEKIFFDRLNAYCHRIEPEVGWDQVGCALDKDEEISQSWEFFCLFFFIAFFNKRQDFSGLNYWMRLIYAYHREVDEEMFVFWESPSLIKKYAHCLFSFISQSKNKALPRPISLFFRHNINDVFSPAEEFMLDFLPCLLKGEQGVKAFIKIIRKLKAKKREAFDLGCELFSNEIRENIYPKILVEFHNLKAKERIDLVVE